MAHKQTVNFAVRTQAFAYQEGFQDALKMLADVLIDMGDSSFMLDVLEDNARGETADRLRAYFDAKGGRK